MTPVEDAGGPLALHLEMVDQAGRARFLARHAPRLTAVCGSWAVVDVGSAVVEVILAGADRSAAGGWLAQTLAGGDVSSARRAAVPLGLSAEVWERPLDEVLCGLAADSARACALLGRSTNHLVGTTDVASELALIHGETGAERRSLTWHRAWLLGMLGDGPVGPPPVPAAALAVAARRAHVQYLRLCGGLADHPAELAVIDGLLSVRR